MAAKSKANPNTTKTAKSAPEAGARKKSGASNLTNTFSPGFWRDHWIPALLMVAVAFAMYFVAMRFGYVLDDEMVVWKNTFVQKGFAGIREIFASDSFLGYFQDKQKLFLLEGGRYRPLSLATFAAEVGVFGKDNAGLPHLSHFVNILLYGLTGTFLYRILVGLFPLQEGGRWYFSLPFIAALLFVLHPLHSEVVANIKGRDEILALLGSLGALYATLKYLDTNRFAWLLVSASSLFLGMLSKENAMTFVAVIPLTAWVFTKAPVNRILGATVPLVVALLAFVVVRFNALGFMLDHGKAVTDLMNDPFLEMSIGEKFATIFLTLGWYLKLLFVPYPLTIDYYPYHVPKVSWTDWRALLSLAAYVGLGIYAVLNIRKRSLVAYAILFWLITLSIVSNLFVSVGSFMNERFAYMPSIAFCLFGAWFLTRKLPEWFKEPLDQPYLIGAALTGVVAAAFGFITFNRVPDWKDAMSLNRSALAVSTNSARAHCFYVTAVYKDQYQALKDLQAKKPLVDSMEYHINRSLEINPNYGAALIMKSAVAAARFEQDHQLDKFFHQIEYVMEKIPYNSNFRDFLDQYMEYLDGSNSDKYVSFCYRAGYEFYFKKKNDPKTAEHFLDFGLKRQTEDIRILESLAEVYTALGDNAKAMEMSARAQAQK